MKDMLEKPVPPWLAVLAAIVALGAVGVVGYPVASEKIESLLHPAGRDCCSPDYP